LLVLRRADLWKTTDQGTTWTTNTDLLPNLGVSGIAIDPLHPDTMYIATGDRDADDTYSIGVLKSTDGWNHLENHGADASADELRTLDRHL